MQTQAVLTHELQLGTTLNSSVKNNHQAKFHLLLAMLSPDACDFPKVQAEVCPVLPEGSASHVASDSHPMLQVGLRLEPLAIGPKRAFAVTHSEPFTRNERTMLENNSSGFADIRLLDALRPQPLSQFDQAKRIESQIKQNTEWRVQQKLEHAHNRSIGSDHHLRPTSDYVSAVEAFLPLTA